MKTNKSDWVRAQKLVKRKKRAESAVREANVDLIPSILIVLVFNPPVPTVHTKSDVKS